MAFWDDHYLKKTSSGYAVFRYGGIFVAIVFIAALALLVNFVIIPSEEKHKNNQNADSNTEIVSNQDTAQSASSKVLLFDLPQLYTSNSNGLDFIRNSEKSGTLIDTKDTNHTYCNHISCYGYSKGVDGYYKYVRYDLNEDYTQICGGLYAYNNDKTCWLEFYNADTEELIYKTPIINDNNPSAKVNINVSGIKHLDVYLCSDDPYNNGGWIISELEILK